MVGKQERLRACSQSEWGVSGGWWESRRGLGHVLRVSEVEWSGVSGVSGE